MMNKPTDWIILGICLFGLSWSLQAQDKIEIKKIDGVTHVFNPAKPLKGTVQLEVEKALAINPYDQPDVAMRSFNFVRRDDGAVILYDFNSAEGHRFGPKGEYLGPLAKKGQGPGEFAPQGGFLPFYLKDKIWVSGAAKLAVFDKDGRFLREQKLKDWLPILIDESHYLAEKAEWNKERTELSKRLSLFRMGDDSLSEVPERDLYQGNGLQPTIVNKATQNRMSDVWSTPNLCYAYSPDTGCVFAAVSSIYKITVMNLKGEILRVIENARENLRISKKDAEIILGPMLKNDRFKWALDAYPERLVAMIDIAPLPNGDLLVCRISGPLDYEMDVFDKDGRYIYALKAPAGQSFKGAKFHSLGYSNIEPQGDFQIYVDYRVKNLPEVFGK